MTLNPLLRARAMSRRLNCLMSWQITFDGRPSDETPYSVLALSPNHEHSSSCPYPLGASILLGPERCGDLRALECAGGDF